MTQAVAARVPLVPGNVSRCVCPRCPVQRHSQCVASKMAVIKDSLLASPLHREAIPAVYCASGLAACRDINLGQPCYCGWCPVYEQYRLAGYQPLSYFCRDGASR